MIPMLDRSIGSRDTNGEARHGPIKFLLLDADGTSRGADLARLARPRKVTTAGGGETNTHLREELETFVACRGARPPAPLVAPVLPPRGDAFPHPSRHRVYAPRWCMQSPPFSLSFAAPPPRAGHGTPANARHLPPAASVRVHPDESISR